MIFWAIAIGAILCEYTCWFYCRDYRAGKRHDKKLYKYCDYGVKGFAAIGLLAAVGLLVGTQQ